MSIKTILVLAYVVIYIIAVFIRANNDKWD